MSRRNLFVVIALILAVLSLVPIPSPVPLLPLAVILLCIALLA
jgi:hypothetical protein